MHKYAPILVGLSRQQVLALDESALLQKSVTLGATKKIIGSLRNDVASLPWIDGTSSKDSSAVATPNASRPGSFGRETSDEDGVQEWKPLTGGRAGCARCGRSDHATFACHDPPKLGIYSPVLDFMEVRRGSK